MIKRLLILTGLFLMISSCLRAEKNGYDIYLIRHAKVNMSKPIVCSAKRAEQLLQEYNKSPILSINSRPVRKIVPLSSVIYTSSMHRAIETAANLFPDADSLVTNSVFNEYGLAIVPVPLIPLPYPVWTSLSRILWILHLNNKGESRHSARIRMKKACSYLEYLAYKRKIVILVGHGYMISELRRELKRRGWNMRLKQGNKNLAVTHLSKTKLDKF